MELDSMQLVSVCLLSIVSIGATTLVILMRSEARLLQQATRSLLRTERAPLGVNLQFPHMLALWRSILALQSSIRTIEAAGATQTEALELSSAVSSSSHDFTSAAGQAVAAVLHQAAPEIVACALLYRADVKHPLAVECCRGVPTSRIEEPLSTYLELALEANIGNAKDKTWGYHVPESGSLIDFSIFLISTQLFLPLYVDNEIRGALWLGFRKGAAGLNSKRMERLRAFSIHAVAAIQSALLATTQRQTQLQKYNSVLGMSHDLRAPGNSAFYALHDLLSGSCGSLNEEQNARLEVIKHSIEDQLLLIDDMLDFARSENHQLRAYIAAEPLAPMLTRVVENYAPLAQRQGLELSISAIPDCAVMVDRQHFKRILSNLLSNAIKYTVYGGEIKIDVQWHQSRAQIAVYDNGIGIPEKEQQILFKEFQRATNAKLQQGVGLGLALSKRLTELNEGTIHYKPRKEGGSVFGISLRALPLESVTPDPLPTISKSSATILLVDDDPAVCRTNARYLREVAGEIITAHSYKEAKELLQTIKPALLVADFNLGDGTAQNLISDLAQNNITLPTIILTGSTYTLEIQNLQKQNNQITILQKPIPRQTLQQHATTLLTKG